MAGYNGAKRGKHGTTLAVAHGGWASLAHERYDRFNISDVLDIAPTITQYGGDEHNTVAAMQRAPLQPPSAREVRRPSPRPDPDRSGTGAARGSKRQRVLRRDDDERLPANTRVQVWWTGERR